MPEKSKKTIYVIGDRNPGADSICSAIAVAGLKNSAAGRQGEAPLSPGYSGAAGGNVIYRAVRAGEIDRETEYILKRFGYETPPLMSDARTQVKDIDYSEAVPVDGDISLLEAWNIMRSISKSTNTVTDSDGMLKGVITMGDIAKSYMAVFDNRILAEAKTPFRNIIDTLRGKLVTGDVNGHVTEGKVLIAAANTDVFRKMTSPGDVVILGNRYEAQLCAIEQQASLLIVDNNAPVSRTIRKIASDRGCTVISTPYDAYDTARLINQSLPVRHFMTTEPICFNENDVIDDIRSTMTEKRLRDFPIVTDEGRCLGTISRRNLINMDRKRFIMVNHNSAKSAIAGISEAEIVEIIDCHRLETVETIRPLVVRECPVGSTATIAAGMFAENSLEIPPEMAGILCCAIISATEDLSSAQCTSLDRDTAHYLAGIAGIDLEETAGYLRKEAGRPCKASAASAGGER